MTLYISFVIKCLGSRICRIYWSIGCGKRKDFVQDDSQRPSSETAWIVGMLIAMWNVGRGLRVMSSVWDMLSLRCAIKRRAKMESGEKCVHSHTHTHILFGYYEWDLSR